MVRPGGRTEANRKAVANAVLVMLTEGNLLFDIQDVADRSGVHRTTIRRRWRDRDALMAEAMSEHTSRMQVDLNGTWETILRRIAFALRDFMADPVEDSLNRMIAISASDNFRRLVRSHWQTVFDGLAVPLLAAQRRGQISADVDISLILRILGGTIMTRVVYYREAAADEFIDDLLAQIIRGMRADPAARRARKRTAAQT